MLTALLVVCSLVIGFAWGFVLTVKYMVIPARKQTLRILDVAMANLEEQKTNLEEILDSLPHVNPDGSVVSPIQIKKD